MKILPLTIVLPLLSAMSAPVLAEELQTAAPAACKGALPSYESSLRVRPLALQNEGSASAFVSCAQQVRVSVNDYSVASVRVINAGSVPAAVNCTLVDGTSDSPSTRYESQSVTVDPGAAEWITFFPPTPATTFQTPFQAYSCSLSPGTGVARVGSLFGES